MEDLLQVIVSIQKETIQMLLKVDELEEESVLQQTTLTNGCAGRESDTFVGFVIKKRGNEGDLGFSIRKLDSWGAEHSCRKKQEGFQPHYIHSIKCNHQNNTVYVTLNRATSLENLLKSTWRRKAEIINDSCKENAPYTLQCHLDDNVDSIVNLRALLYTLFVQRLIKWFQANTPDIACNVRASHVSDTASDGFQSSSDVSQSTSCGSQTYCVLSAEAIASIESDLSIKHLEFKQEDAVGDEEQYAVAELEQRFPQFLCEKEEADESGRVDINLKLFVQSSAVRKCAYSKGVESTQISDESGHPTDHLKNALMIKRVFSTGEISVIHIASSRRLVHVEKTMLLTEMLLPNIKVQKVCVFNEHANSMISMCLQERKEELFVSYQSRYGNIVKGSQWDDTIHNVAVSSLTLDILSLSLNKQLNISQLEDTSCLSSRKSLFILYNYARLCKILEHFQQKVEEGLYETLPEEKSVCCALLTEEAEWKLVVRYILLYPSLLQHLRRSVCSAECGQMELQVKLLCTFLCDLCHEFSSYYHHTKVLLNPRPHLAPLMFARLYLITTLKKMMDSCFSLLGVIPPQQM